jgi:hypothetical protein
MSDAFPSRYLKAEDLEEGDLVVTISEAVYEEFSDPKTKRVEQKPVLHFQGKDTKPLVLNKTNWKTITQVLGSDETDDWTGKRIALYAVEVESFGEMVLGIRVRLKSPAKTVAAPGNRPQAVPIRKVTKEEVAQVIEEVDAEDIPF